MRAQRPIVQLLSLPNNLFRGWTPHMIAVGSKLLRIVLQAGLAASWGIVGVGNAAAQPVLPAPIYWQENLFYIPYQANAGVKLAQRVAKVQLLLARDGSSDWRILQEAQPNVRGFSYHAPGDGEYWFAVRHQDRFGRVQSDPASQPKLRIVVDTMRPELRLEAALGVSGAILVRYESRDANLNPESLLLEVRVGQQQWTAATVDAPDVSQPDKLIGRATWQPPFGANVVGVRASISDRAGHRAVANTEVIVTGSTRTQLPPVPGETYPHTAAVPSHGFSAEPAPNLSARDWPASNRLPPVVQRPGPADHFISASSGPPPVDNAYAAPGQGGAFHGTPAKLVADRASGNPGRQRGGSHESLPITPLDVNHAPEPDGHGVSEPAAETHGGWTSDAHSMRPSVRTVNSSTFDVEYDLESVPPWGVSRVELWGTHDGGRSWQNYGVDPDNRTPLRATVPGSGVYGFRILVQGATGAPARHPHAGDQAELVVVVDLLPPKVELIRAALGQDGLADHLVVEWTATDTNLEPRPIALFYSSSPSGPWTTIAAGLENTGNYTWRMERHIPDRFYLQIAVHDTAGNRATDQTASPFVVPRAQPTGRLRNVRPVVNNR